MPDQQPQGIIQLTAEQLQEIIACSIAGALAQGQDKVVEGQVQRGICRRLVPWEGTRPAVPGLAHIAQVEPKMDSVLGKRSLSEISTY